MVAVWDSAPVAPELPDRARVVVIGGGLALEISRHYGVDLKSDDERNGNIFASLRSLAGHIEACRTL